MNGNVTLFSAKFYGGEQGRYLDYVTVDVVSPLLTVVQLNSSNLEPYQPLRYISYLASNSNASQVHLYLLHQMRVQPDFDAIVHAVLDPSGCTSDLEREKLNHLLEQNGNEWAFHGLENGVSYRLTSGYARAQLLGDIYSTACSMQIIAEIQCTI